MIAADDPTDGADRLADLLDAHHYTDGLAFLAAGHPDEQQRRRARRVRQPRSPRRAELRRRVARVHPDARPTSAPPPTPAGSAPPSASPPPRIETTLGRIAGAGGGDEALAEAMQTALWPATWGYYLVAVHDARRRRTRAGSATTPVASSARPGALPTLRCGRQPYGVLPVTSLAGWSATGDDAAPSRAAAPAAGDAARPGVATGDDRRRQRVGRSDDPGADVVDVLRGGPTSAGYHVRRALGPHYLRAPAPLPRRGPRRDRLLRPPAPAHVEPAEPGRVPGSGRSRPVRVRGRQLARSACRSARDADGTLAYLAALLAGDPDTPRRAGAGRRRAAAARAAPPRPAARARRGRRPRCSPAPDAVARRAARRRRAGRPRARRRHPTATWTWQRSQPLPGGTAARTVGDHLAALDDFAAPEVRPLGELRAAMARARRRRPGQRSSGCCPPRSTPPRTGSTRGSRRSPRGASPSSARPSPTGVVLGGYGWVEQLRPEPRQRRSPSSRPTNPGRCSPPPDDPGFIVAPSLDQASTAALLREAHLAHGGSDDSPYAIKLTSDRVRLAERLFDGVRQGIPLGVLLGYDVERRLHEAALDELIDDLRRIAPPPGTTTATRRSPDARSSTGSCCSGRGAPTPTAVLAQIDGLTADDPRRERLVRVLGVARRGGRRRGRRRDRRERVPARPRQPRPRRDARRHRRRPRPAAAARADAHAAHRHADHPPGGDRPRRRRPRRPGERVGRRGVAAGAGRAAPRRLGGGDARAGDRRRRRRRRARRQRAGSTRAPRAAHRPRPVGARPGVDQRRRRGRHRARPAGVRRVARRRGRRDAGRAAARARAAPTDPQRARDLGDLLEVAGALRRLVAGARPLDGADLQPAHADPDRRVDLDELESQDRRRPAGARRPAATPSARLLDDPAPTVGAIRRALGGGRRVRGRRRPRPARRRRRRSGATGVGGVPVGERRVRRRHPPARPTPSASGRRRPDEPEPARRDRLVRRVRACSARASSPCRCSAPRRPPTSTPAHRSAALLADDPLGAVHVADAAWSGSAPALARLTMPYAPGRRARHRSRPRPVGRPRAAHRRPAVDRGHARRRRRRRAPTALASIVLQGAADVDLAAPLAGLLVDEWTEVVPRRHRDGRARLPLRPARRDGTPGGARWPCRRTRRRRGPSARSTGCCSRRSTSPTCAPPDPSRSTPSGTTCRRRCWRSTSTATPCPPIPTRCIGAPEA